MRLSKKEGLELSLRCPTRRQALAALCCLPLGAYAKKERRKPLIVLDPGHHPSQPGALSASGYYEVAYNDQFAAELAELLRYAGWNVVLTRTPKQNKTLAERAAVAGQIDADLFLSIHHDSVRPEYVERFEYEGRKAQRTTRPFSGHSLFVSSRNVEYEVSYIFASMIARAIADYGRAPALYHADPVLGESRPLLDKRYGVYRFDGLAVLHKNTVPAVLMEVGVLPDPADEAWVSIRENRHALQWAIAKAAKNLWVNYRTF